MGVIDASDDPSDVNASEGTGSRECEIIDIKHRHQIYWDSQSMPDMHVGNYPELQATEPEVSEVQRQGSWGCHNQRNPNWSYGVGI